MPWQRSCASKVISLSRIVVVCTGVKGEEVADHLLENEFLEAPKIEQTELQSLFDGSQEGTGGVGAFQLEQTAQSADPAAVSTLLEGGGIALETGMMASQELLFQGGTAAHPYRGGMMLGQGVASVALVDEPRMPGDLRATSADANVGRILVDGDRLPDEALRDRVAIRVHRDVAVKIDNALECLVHRRQSVGQRLQGGILDQIGRFRGHAQHAFGLLIGDIPAPSQRLPVQVLEAAEATRREEVGFYIKKWPFDSTLSIGMTDLVSLEPEAQRAGKGDHLGGHDGVGAGAVSDDDTGIVDHTERTSTVHEPRCFEKEVFGLEATESWVILGEQAARIGQHQPSTLRGDRLTRDHHAVRRRVVLSLGSWGMPIFARSPWRTAQSRISNPARQRAVGDLQRIFVGEQLLRAHHVAACPLEGVLEPGQDLRLACRRRGATFARAQNTAHRITRELQQSTDLAQAQTLGL